MTSDETILQAMRARYYATDHSKAKFFEVSDEEWDAAAVRMERDHGVSSMRAAFVRKFMESGPDLDPQLRPHFMGLPLKLRKDQG